MIAKTKNRLTPAPKPPPPLRGGWRGVAVLGHQISVSVDFDHGKKSHGKVISNPLKTTKTVILGLRKVSVTLFWSLVLFYVIDAVKSYEGHQDPTHN